MATSEELTLKRLSLKDGTEKVFIQGALLQDAEKPLLELRKLPPGRVIVDVSGVSRINSCGVREWINAFRNLSDELQIEFHNCSIPFMEQVNMISNFVKKGSIVSFLVPFICSECEEGSRLMVKTPQGGAEVTIRPPECQKCGVEMEMQDEPEDYFHFLD